MYQPSKGDIIWLDFDPARGREIKKRRPALVLSSAKYTRLTQLILVSPITQGAQHLVSMGFNVELAHEQLQGNVNALQVYTYDFIERNARYIGTCEPDIVNQVLNIQQFIYQD